MHSAITKQQETGNKTDVFLAELKHLIDTDELVLPSLPEVALRIREAAEDENMTARDITETLMQDPSLTARLIQVANSPLYRTRNPIDDLQVAVTRLGIRLVRDLVINLAMKQIYQATSDVLDEQFRAIWNTSIETASICRMMATITKGLNPEQALLAGLIHNIGALPILVKADEDYDLLQDPETLAEIVYSMQGEVGVMILNKWNFPEQMIEVVDKCNDFSHTHDGGARLVDVVQVALLQGEHVPEKYRPGDLSAIPAFANLGMDSEVNVVDIEENKEVIENTKQSLMI
jgi:HD-like signal output (HDOD) protein